MGIVSKAAITDFCKKHKDAAEPLVHWYLVAKRARWTNLADVREDFRHADVVGPLTAFKVAGNKYRLIAVIKYRWQLVYIRQPLVSGKVLCRT